MAERTAAAFLGVRVECAQCHKHPFDRWTQADYRAFANVFADVQFGLSPEGLSATARLLEQRRKSDPNGTLAPIPRLSETYRLRASFAAAGRPRDRPAASRPRRSAGRSCPRPAIRARQLFAWLTQPDNPYFARSFVNRVWAVYFGVGLVDPVDGFSVANPPSNARLLDALAADFVAHGLRHPPAGATVLSSRAYQRSSEPARGTSTTTATSPAPSRGR